MEKIKHSELRVNEINMHVAEIGEGPAVLFVHGFPELWYSWRYQMLRLSSRGYRAIAPDLRGYGDTDVPPSATSYTILHVVGDLVALLDALGLDQVFLVGHDWGAVISWWLALFRPNRIKALVNLSVAFIRRHPSIKFLEGFRAGLGDDFYMCKFQKPGVMEQYFAAVGTTNTIKMFLSSRDPTRVNFPKEIPPAADLERRLKLPSWLTEEDVSYYAAKFEKTGFTGGLNYYRALDLSWELTAAWTGSKVLVPTIFMVGDLDLTNSFPGFKEYVHGEGFKRDVPNLEEVMVMEGVAHFLNQEKPEEISEHIYAFIKKF